MKQVVVFGAEDMAEIAHFYLTNDSFYDVAAFTVDGDYIKDTTLHGLPFIPFEEIEREFSPAEFTMFIAIGYSKLNALRADKCIEAKKKGYDLISYVSSKATVWPGFEARENTFILEDNTIQPFVTIGKNVTLWSGNHIGHHSVIEDNVFIASHVVISGGVTVEENCFIGVNATIRDHVTIAKNCVIGAGALILKDTKGNGVYCAKEAELSRVPSNRLRGI